MIFKRAIYRIMDIKIMKRGVDDEAKNFKSHSCLSLYDPGGSDGKASAFNVGDPVNPWVGKILWRRKCQPTPVLLPGKSHGWRSVVGYSPWGCKELDTTEQLHFLYHLSHKESPRMGVVVCYYCYNKLTQTCCLKTIKMCYLFCRPEISLG